MRSTRGRVEKNQLNQKNWTSLQEPAMGGVGGGGVLPNVTHPKKKILSQHIRPPAHFYRAPALYMHVRWDVQSRTGDPPGSAAAPGGTGDWWLLKLSFKSRHSDQTM